MNSRNVRIIVSIAAIRLFLILSVLSVFLFRLESKSLSFDLDSNLIMPSDLCRVNCFWAALMWERWLFANEVTVLESCSLIRGRTSDPESLLEESSNAELDARLGSTKPGVTDWRLVLAGEPWAESLPDVPLDRLRASWDVRIMFLILSQQKSASWPSAWIQTHHHKNRLVYKGNLSVARTTFSVSDLTLPVSTSCFRPVLNLRQVYSDYSCVSDKRLVKPLRKILQKV